MENIAERVNRDFERGIITDDLHSLIEYYERNNYYDKIVNVVKNGLKYLPYDFYLCSSLLIYGVKIKDTESIYAHMKYLNSKFINDKNTTEMCTLHRNITVSQVKDSYENLLLSMCILYIHGDMKLAVASFSVLGNIKMAHSEIVDKFVYTLIIHARNIVRVLRHGEQAEMIKEFFKLIIENEKELREQEGRNIQNIIFLLNTIEKYDEKMYKEVTAGKENYKLIESCLKNVCHVCSKKFEENGEAISVLKCSHVVHYECGKDLTECSICKST